MIYHRNCNVPTIEFDCRKVSKIKLQHFRNLSKINIPFQDD